MQDFYDNRKSKEALPQKTVPILKLGYSIALPILVILTVVVVMVVYTSMQKREVVKNADYVAERTAVQISKEVELTINYAKSSIRGMATSVMVSMDSPTLENPSEIILPLCANTPFSGVEYIRADGMNVMTSGEAFDASDRIYYIEGIKGNSGIWINYNPKSAKDNLINFYTPLFYQGKTVGVITGYIEAWADIASLLKSEFFGQEVYGFLLDGEDKVICSTYSSEYVSDFTLDMFLDSFNVSEELKQKAHQVVDTETEGTVTFKSSDGEGRVCVKKIPDTDWRVVVFIPSSSFNSIVSSLSRNATGAIAVAALIMLLYVVFVLFKTVTMRKQIAIQNFKLQEDNRAFNEQNKMAFEEISEIRDIIASANMGTWHIELVEGEEPRMYVDDKMKELLGLKGLKTTPESTYSNWFDNITHTAVPSVLKSVEKMKAGFFDENTYLWVHPEKGVRYVRCGGTSRKISGGYSLRGYHYDVDEVVRAEQAQVEKLKDALTAKNEYYSTLGALGDVFYSMHVIDLVEDTVTEFNAKDEVKEIVDHKNGAIEMMRQVMNALTAEECREECLEFTDLTTVAERMYHKMIISKELIGKNIGWYDASFVVMETDEEGRATKVIFATRVIDEKKKQEENLIFKSNTDELTQVSNRRAYEEALQELEAKGMSEDFAYISFDVNGLKTVNDSIGHEAGDELIVGASICMRRALGNLGRIYRIGGDEFVALLRANAQSLKDGTERLESYVDEWRGRLVKSMSISYGVVTYAGNPELNIHDIAVLADKRMYEAKSDFYRRSGVDRRGRKDAHVALCNMYAKILKINVTKDIYQIINMKKEEQILEEGTDRTISGWFAAFAEEGKIYPEDRATYMEKTNLGYIRSYFAENDKPLRIVYRREAEEGFRNAVMEIIKANDYSENDMNLFLYVKYIE